MASLDSIYLAEWTDRARKVLLLAAEFGRRRPSGQVMPIDVLYGLVKEGSSSAAAFLASKGVTLESIQQVDDLVRFVLDQPGKEGGASWK